MSAKQPDGRNDERLSDVLAGAYTPPPDAPPPSDELVEDWIRGAEIWRRKRDYQRQLDAARLHGYAFNQRYCEEQHNDNMKPENIIPALRELLELRAAVSAAPERRALAEDGGEK